MRDPTKILDVIRWDNESVDDFVSRFNGECLNIGRISEGMLRGTFRKDVRSSDLICCLTGRDGMPKTLDKFVTTAKVFATTEHVLGRDSPKQSTKVELKNTWLTRPARESIWSRIKPPAETSKQPDAR